MASILCDPLTFLALPDDKRREILFRLIPGLNPTGEDIFQKLKAMIPDLDPGSALPHEMATLVATKGFKLGETEAITRRRIAKRVRDEANVEEPEQRTTIGGKEFILPDIQQAEVQAGIDTLRAERDKLLQKRGKVEAQTDKLSELEQELGALVSDPVETPEPGEIEEWQKALNINRPILEDLEKKVESLESGCPAKLFPSTCPAFTSRPPCPAAGQIAIPAVEPSDPAKAAKFRADLEEEKKEVARLEAGLKETQTKQTAYDEYTKKRQELADKIAKLKEHQEQATATAGLDQQIEALNTRMKTGWELLDAIRDFWRQKEAAEAAQAKIGEAEKEIAFYDAMAKALAPDGIPSQLIGEAISPVNDLLEVASVLLFPGRDLALTEDLNIELFGSPYATLSKSAKFRVGVAFQYVLAKLAGARLLLIDEADLLDPSNRTALIDFLLEIQPDFDTIIIFATSQEAKPSSIPEIQIWWLESGRIRPVERDDAACDQATG